jgi:hypothetical protein
MVRVHINFKYIDPFSAELDSQIEAWFNRLDRQKNRKRGIDGETSWMDIGYINLSEFLLVMSKDNGGVENYMPFVKVSDIAATVPDGLSNRMKQVNIGTEEDPVYEDQSRTWQEWIDNGGVYDIAEVEGFYYFTSVAGTGGFSLTDNELLIINNNIGSELVDSIPII